jgi:hypothetical protein
MSTEQPPAPAPGSENQDALQAGTVQQQQKPLTAEQILIKLILDGQNNINQLSASQQRLTSIQEQQMIYINMLIKNVNSNNESVIPSTQSNSSAVQIQSGTINTTEEGKSPNSQSIT